MLESGNQEGGFCRECLIVSLTGGIVSGVMLGLGLLNMLYLVPLQLVASRRGGKPFLFSAGVAIVVSVFIMLFQEPGSEQLIVYSSVAGTLAGLILLNSGKIGFMPDFPRWQKVAGAGILSSLGLLVSVLYIERQNIWQELMLIVQSSEELQVLLLEMVPVGGVNELFALLRDIIYRSLLFSGSVVLLLGYGLGRAVAEGIRNALMKVAGFELPQVFIWVFIGSAAVLMAGEALAVYPAAYAGWNIFLFTALLYCIKGLSIVSELAAVRPLLRLALPGLVILGIFMPGFNIFLGVIFALMGLSSIWITYSNGTGDAGSAES